MKIEIRENKVYIEGYVNAVERLSKLIHEDGQVYRERIAAGAFAESLKKNDKVPILLNHDTNRMIGRADEPTTTLTEDNIGLRIQMETADAEIVEKARNNQLNGWSFGFNPIKTNDLFVNGEAIKERTELELVEVSLLDNNRHPAYEGCSVYVRADGATLYRYGEDYEQTAERSDAFADIVCDKVIHKLAEQKAINAEYEKRYQKIKRR